jgi:glucose-1-phosphate thymidylyltransferase
MKAVIPVAGMGRRLRPHTLTMPKALVPVAGKPILGHILDEIAGLRIEEVILILGPTGDPIRAYVERAYRFKTQYAVQQEALGIGHAIYQCRAFLDDEPVLIVLGDTVYHTDFSVLSGGLPTSAVGVKALSGDLRRYGLVEVDGERVIRLVEKPEHPPSNLALAGVYYIAETGGLVDSLETLIRTGRKTHGEYQLTDALQGMVERGMALHTFPVDEWYDCGTPEQLLATNRRALEWRSASCAIPGSTVIPPVAIAPDARIAASVIGPYVSVSAGAFVSRAVITNSIIGEGAVVQDCCLDASIVGPQASITGTSHRVNAGAGAEMIL